ncbi:conserved hypothetical protein [Candidatus Sulfopaludibacter sp. SbA3]|nr:conserved hypothetical protein [Candidatus Sulfopaludibacter sp. SbA3]
MDFLTGIRTRPAQGLLRFAAREIWLGSILLIAAHATLFAQSAGEYEIKAVFLYKFASFVQWPDDGSGPLCIGVLGQDPFGTALEEAVRGKSINSRPFLVRRSRKAQDLEACQIVFIAVSESKQLRALLSHLQTAVLTVGDMPEFCESGGIIGFDLMDRRIRLRINLEAAQRARLQLSSKLLSLAKLVGGAGQ